MNVRKFYASTTREALKQVRDALGVDAIILSNRQVVGGIEIMAVADRDVDSLAAAGVPPPPRSPKLQAQPEPARAASPERKKQASAPAPVAGQEAPLTDGVIKDIIKEIKFLRGMVEGQLAGFAWGDLQRRDPAKVEILRTLLAVGLSPTLSRQLLDRLPADSDFNKGLRWVKAALTHNLRVAGTEDAVVDQGGIYALVGPTGVGKTTTVAKLAARCTLKHGASKVVMLTTDSYRIGAHEQLRIYGKILGVPVYAIKDESDLQLTLSDLRHKHLVLIDTVGMSQRDRRVAEQIEMLSGNGRKVRRLLLLSATSQGDTLDEVVRTYETGAFPDSEMAGCILTKIDEAVSVGNVLDVIIRHRLMLHFVTNGQRVPEDMHLPNAHYLIDRAFKMAQAQTPFSLQEAEYPLVMAEGYAPAEPVREAVRG
jgi:flagellar biosynthetic protein FlhF